MSLYQELPDIVLPAHTVLQVPPDTLLTATTLTPLASVATFVPTYAAFVLRTTPSQRVVNSDQGARR